MKNHKEKQREAERNFCLLYFLICRKCGSVFHKAHKVYFANGFEETKIICNCGYVWYMCHGHTTHNELQKLYIDIQKSRKEG